MKYFSFLLLFFYCINCYTQNNSEYCHSQNLIPDNAVSYLHDDIPTFFNVENYSFCVKIYVHIVRRLDGSGGVTDAEALESIGFLNTDFNSLGIYFNWDGVDIYLTGYDATTGGGAKRHL